MLTPFLPWALGLCTKGDGNVLVVYPHRDKVRWGVALRMKMVGKDKHSFGGA